MEATIVLIFLFFCSLILIYSFVNGYISAKNVTVISPYQALVNATYREALSGDQSARDWMMENVFCKQENSIMNNQVATDAIDALVAIGFSEKEAFNRVSKCLNNRTYNTYQQLITDALQ